MTRIQTLASRPKRTLGALAVVLAAVGITVGSGANFSASKANAGTFAAGTLSIGNQNDKTVFTGANLRPGDAPATGSVDVTNTGSLSGNFYLLQDTGATSTAAADQALLGKLRLTITDCGPAAAPDCSTPIGGAPVYDGPMTGFTSQVALRKLGTGAQTKWPAGESHHFTFEVAFPNDSSALDGSDDAAQGGKVAATYTWKATS